jgi:polyhydroxyalkanoate synthesis repressor PhaR
MSDAVRIIKKYPNRRLYDTETSSYITLADVKKLVIDQVGFRVEDAKTKDDLTRSILLQIILEEEAAGSPMFSSDMLAQIIRFYGNAMQGMMGNYLEKNIQTFIKIQKHLQDQSHQIYGANPMLNADAWSEFLKMQGPAMQGLMGRYLEQSANAFLEMQQQLQRQTQNLFGNFPFSGFTAPQNPASGNDTKNKPDASSDKK